MRRCLFLSQSIMALRLVDRRAGAVPVQGGRQRGMRFATVVPAQLIGFVFVDRARVSDLFGNAKFVQLVDDLARLHFQLPRQLIDSNLTHIEAFRLRAFTNADRFTTHSGLRNRAFMGFRP
jgi:hypothetical protein